MAEYTDDLALIVRYDGTKDAFDAVKNNYLGKVVFITGSSATGATTAEKKQAVWVSNGVGGKYLDMSNIDTLKSELEHITKIYVDGNAYDGTGGVAYKFVGADGIGVVLSQANGQAVITFSGADLKTAIVGTSSNNSNTTIDPDTITGAKAYADRLKTLVEGDSNKDTFTSHTIAGAKKYADKVKSDLEGTESDTITSATIAGAKKYADDAVAKIVSNGNDAAADDTIKGAKKYTDEAKESLLGKSGDASTENTIYGAKAYADTKDITIDSTNTDDTLAGKFVIKKNGIELATINIPKDLVVKSGQVVVNPSGQPAGTYIELTIQNQDAPLYINVADLVDAYTAEDTSTINITISTDNKISASVKGDSIETSMLKNSAVTTAKIADANVTTDKIADGAVSYDKLDQSVKTSLGKADNAVTDVGVSIPTDDADYLTGTKSSSGTIRTINLDLKTETIENATSDATKKGLATAEDVAAYLKARLSVKVVS